MPSLKSPGMRWLRITWLTLGLGWLAGGFEALTIAGLVRLNLSFSELLAVSALAVAAGGLLSLPCGLAAGLVVQAAGRRWLDSTALAAGTTLALLPLSGFYLLYAASIQWSMGKPRAAFAMAVYPLGIAGFWWFNSRYWLRREEIGAPHRLGWTLLAPLLALAMCLGAAGVGAGRGAATSRALAGDPNVLLITIDTLRRDHVGAFNPLSPASTPRIDALAEEGVIFLDAVTPTPETGPAHASMFTALHPLRHGVLHNGLRLDWGHTTLAERLRDEGYATGAFLSSYAVAARSGLDQGFAVYDDDFLPRVRGAGQVLAVQHLMRLAMASGHPHRVAPLLEREGARTVDIALGWLERQGQGPFFAWVHLFEPHAPYEGEGAAVDHRALLSDPGHAWTDAERAALRAQYAEEVERADAEVGRLLDALEALGLADDTLVIVVSDHGEMLGEHGVDFRHHGLWEDVVRVPLVLRAPGRPFRDRRIPQQVRLMDLAPTVLAYVKLDPIEPSEGVELLGYPLGLRDRSLAADLLGRRDANLREGCLYGLRTEATFGEREVRVKYLVDPGSGQEWLFNVQDDPDEAQDIQDRNAEALAVGRQRVAASRRGAPCGEEGGASGAERAMLEALGYIDAPPAPAAP